MKDQLERLDDQKKWCIIADQLERWYKNHQRTFYWRVNRLSPYEVLVLEILLWKTKAEFVDSLYEQFIAQYPSSFELSQASVSELENALKPLGLYKRRAKLLKDIAERLVKEHDGSVPRDLDVLMKLPGVGQYIAQAVLCFGYDEPVFPIDVNILRFFDRVWGVKLEYPRKIIPRIQEKMQYLLQSPSDSAAERMKHLLDFMGTTCKAVKPACQDGKECPLQEVCVFFSNIQNSES